MIGHEERSRGSVKVLAVLLFLVEVGIMFAYGFGTTAQILTTTGDNSNLIMFYILPAILAILGWGLIIAYSENSAVSGLMTTLITVGLSVQLQPLLHNFWIYVLRDFKGKFTVGMTNETQTMVMCVSLLIAFCSLSGRLGLIQIFSVIICFNIGWPLNYEFIQWVKQYKWTATDIGEIQDSIGSTDVYLFAGVFALMVSIFLNLKEGNRAAQSGSRQSAFIGMIGTGFAFAAAPFTGLAGSTLPALYQSPLNVYFALTASVITTYIFSALFGNFKIGVRESLVGVLGGAAIIGSVSAFINNIGGCIAVGAFAGFVSGLWLRYAHPRVNANKAFDHLGIIGPITINAFFGTTFVAPLLYGAYKNASFSPAQLAFKVNSERPSTYFLAIFGITLLVAIGTGVLTGIIVFLTRDPGDDFHFGKVVSTDFGLYQEGKGNQAAPAVEQPHYSASHLRQDGA